MINLKGIRNSLDMTQKDVSDILGITRGAYTNIENGKRQPDNETLIKLSEIFGISVDYLLGVQKKGVKIPVLGKVQAGIPVEAIEEIIGYEEITEDMAIQGNFFALQVRGQSMEPKFSEGDVAIIQQQPDVDSGNIAVVLVNGNDATIKKVIKQKNGISLVPLNPIFEPMFYTNEEILSLPVTVLGKVVELRSKF